MQLHLIVILQVIKVQVGESPAYLLCNVKDLHADRSDLDIAKPDIVLTFLDPIMDLCECFKNFQRLFSRQSVLEVVQQMDLDLVVILLGEKTVNDVIDEERRQGLQSVVIFLQKFEHVLVVATSHHFSDKSDYHSISS